MADVYVAPQGGFATLTWQETSEEMLEETPQNSLVK